MTVGRLRFLPWSALTGLLCLGLLSAAEGGGLGAFSIPLAPHGDGVFKTSGAPLALTPTSFLILAGGPDNLQESADDEILLVTQLDGTPTITPLSVPFAAGESAPLVRLSATRALTVSAGPDGKFGGADDQVTLLDRLGSDNVVTPITVEALGDLEAGAPVALSSSSAVVRTNGPDHTSNTADDLLVLLTGLGGTNTITPLSAPFTSAKSLVGPVDLSPTSALLVSTGADGRTQSGDDQVYLFTGLGGANNRTTLPLANISNGIPGRPTRVSATRALIALAGADHSPGTADDTVALLDGLGTTNAITPIPVPNLSGGLGAPPAVLSGTLVAIATGGPDSGFFTADDTVAVISGLGSTNTVTHVAVGGIGFGSGSSPQRISPSLLALTTGGPGRSFNSADDELVLISGVGATNTVTRVPLPGLDDGETSQPVPLGGAFLLVAGGGANGVIDTGGDDVINVVSAAGKVAVTVSTELRRGASACRPLPLGGGRSVSIASGANGTIGKGGDDLVRVLTGLPQLRGIQVNAVNLNFTPGQPAKKQTFNAGGDLAIDDATLLQGVDLTISLGNIAQRIPAALIKKKANGTLEYRDANGKKGLFRKIILNPVAGTFSISGQGKSTGVETTAGPYIPVAIDAGGVYLSDVVAGAIGTKGIKFRRS